MKLFILFCAGVGVGFFCPAPVPGLLILWGIASLFAVVVCWLGRYMASKLFPDPQEKAS